MNSFGKQSNFIRDIIDQDLLDNKNNRQVINEATDPGANFNFPILKKVTNNKLIFLIMFGYRCNNFRGYSFFFSN